MCIPEYTREYQVVGVMERPSLFNWEPYSAPGYTAVTFLGPEKAGAAVEGKLFIFLNKASEKSVREEAERLSSFLKQEEEVASKGSCFMDDAGLKEYTRSLNVEASALFDAKHPQAILINKAVLRYKDGVSECRILKEAPSPFTLHTPETNENGVPSDSMPFALLDSVIFVEEAPMGLSYPALPDYLSLVVSKEVMDSLNEKYRFALHSEEAAEDTKLYIRTNQPRDLSKRLVWLEKEERVAGRVIFVIDHL